MEQGRPRSSLSLTSSASTVSSLSSLSAKKPTRVVHKVHAFGKRNNALRRDPNLPVHIRGWLHKQDSSGLRLWKRRWFVLSGHCLFYYKDSREESVLGSVLLPSYSVRPDGPGAPRGRRFTFTAEHPGMRTYVLAADTLEDLRGWLRALGKASRAEGEDWPFSPLSRPPSPLSLPRPRSAPVRRPPLSAGDISFPARPHTPLSRIDVRPPLDWGPQRQTLSRPPIPRRGPFSEAGGGRPPRSPQLRTPEHRTQSTQVSSGSSTYLQLPPRPPGTQASMILLPGPPVDSTLHQSLETDTLLTKLCGQDRLLRQLQEDLDKRQEEKEQLEAALELTRQQLGQATREAAASGKAWGRQRLLQDRLVNVRAALCHLTQERERVWDTYSGLEQDLGTLRETLEYLLHLGSPQDRASAQQQLWMVEDTLAGLGGPQKQPPHTEPKSPSPAPQREESSERESLSESLELSSPQSPEVDWGQPPGGDRALSSSQSGVGSPRVSRASSPECRQQSSPLLRTKAPLARPRMSAQEQLERMRRNQACGLSLPRPTSPRLLTLGRTLSPVPRQPDMEQRPIVGAAKWLRSSGSWSSLSREKFGHQGRLSPAKSTASQ
ncbi:pleckstrin homology domain-containing family A member 4 isoform X5 [Rattus norvegicus]|uniref:pleckstrin homology domain-containing family A member 4 isoform X5 n=1 Tax=Rattus norvegicus TaxID=10116 RepID=UPI002FD84E09